MFRIILQDYIMAPCQQNMPKQKNGTPESQQAWNEEFGISKEECICREERMGLFWPKYVDRTIFLHKGKQWKNHSFNGRTQLVWNIYFILYPPNSLLNISISQWPMSLFFLIDQYQLPEINIRQLMVSRYTVLKWLNTVFF